MRQKRKQQRRREKPRIPEFASREEEAKFWDTHDIADYQGELKTTQARFARRLSGEKVTL